MYIYIYILFCVHAKYEPDRSNIYLFAIRISFRLKAIRCFHVVSRALRPHSDIVCRQRCRHDRGPPSARARTARARAARTARAMTGRARTARAMAAMAERCVELEEDAEVARQENEITTQKLNTVR